MFLSYACFRETVIISLRFILLKREICFVGQSVPVLTGNEMSFLAHSLHKSRGSASCLCTKIERTLIFTDIGDTMEAALQRTGKESSIQKKKIAARLRKKNSSENRNKITLGGHF